MMCRRRLPALERPCSRVATRATRPLRSRGWTTHMRRDCEHWAADAERHTVLTCRRTRHDPRHAEHVRTLGTFKEKPAVKFLDRLSPCGVDADQATGSVSDLLERQPDCESACWAATIANTRNRSSIATHERQACREDQAREWRRRSRDPQIGDRSARPASRPECGHRMAKRRNAPRAGDLDRLMLHCRVLQGQASAPAR
jgi:hypothetical protein